MKKVIIITGASSGFGKATSHLLAQRGHKVYGTSRRQQADGEVNFLQADVCNPAEIEKAVNTILEKEGRIDVLINNAGLGIGGALELATEEETAMQMNTNFMGCVNMCKAVLPTMRRQRCGRIINLSSIGGVMGLPVQGFYSASKFAIEGYSEALAAEVKQFGISVSMVEPGDFATNFTANRKNSDITLNDSDYGASFSRAIKIIEKEENGGLRPEILAKKMVHIVECRKPRLRYVVANLEQRLSVVLKRILPGNMFVNILRDYYKV